MMEKLQQMIKKFSDAIYRKGLQFTLLISFSLVAVVMILIVTFVYSKRLSVAHEEMLEANNSSVIEQVAFGLDQSIQNMMQATNVSYYDILKDADLDVDKERVSEEFSFLLRSHDPQISSIAVFDSHGEPLVVVPADRPFRKGISVKKEKWYLSAMAQIENIHISAPYVDNLFKSNGYDYPRVITFSRNVEINRGGLIYQGVLMINMNFDAAERILTQSDNSMGSFFLTQSSGNVIYHPQQILLDQKLLALPNQIKNKSQDGVYRDDSQKDSQIVTIKTMGYTGWKLIRVEPISETIPKLTDNRVVIWGLALIACLSLLIINLVISSRITTPLKNLEKAVTQIEENLDDLTIPEEGTFEIQHLSHALMTMTDTMKRLMRDIVVQQEKIRENELSVLQAQINPHFLYNTLDSTVWMIESGRCDGAIQMITALAKLFRLSLSKGKKIITIGEELEHVRNYLMIQENRYKNKFVWTILVEEELKDHPCLKLIVQPIVENAIYHGMDYIYEDGEINIRAYRIPEGINIDVEDNGPGMTEEQVKALIKGEVKFKKGSGVGFRNVAERIKLHYGPKFGLTVISEPDEGTIVRILIPFEEAEAQNGK
ncbi:sensor histidine kinase [Enterococcus devriesei]|uniref:sensor histidine kinase n=1 Tax=Enterococcus devriesei TaxID=319970 RepID=UPI0028F10A6B|nr:sensor histidine kinase [Enterococcus devriesei]